MEQLLGESNSEYNSRKEFYDFLVEEKTQGKIEVVGNTVLDNLTKV